MHPSMAANDDDPRKSLHIVMLPWLAFGHIIPFLELSKLLAQKGHRVSFLSTPRNIDRLSELMPANDSVSSITLVKIPLPKVAELPENAEATMDIDGGQMGYLKKAYDGLEPGVARFLEESDADWIIHDFSPHWLPSIAASLGIPRVFFFIMNAWFLGFYGPSDSFISWSDYRTDPEDFMVPPRWVKFETSVAYRRFETGWIVGSAQKDDSGFSDAYRLRKAVTGVDAIALRHCYEFEPNWLSLLEELHHKQVIPVGLMPPNLQGHHNTGKDEDDDDDEIWVPIKNWLDGQNESSVIYVALGSEVTPGQDLLDELAHGLELSGVPFFWVVRKASGSSGSDPVELPTGFEERVNGRGIVWRSWAPQLKILNHNAVGGFLTHSGWSSTVEGLMFGHPLITLPFLVDQGLNSRVIAENKLGVEVPRDEEDGTYTRNSVAESVKQAMVEDKGKEMRKRAREMAKIFGDTELHNGYINKFVEFLENHRITSRKLIA